MLFRSEPAARRDIYASEPLIACLVVPRPRRTAITTKTAAMPESCLCHHRSRSRKRLRSPRNDPLFRRPRTLLASLIEIRSDREVDGLVEGGGRREARQPAASSGLVAVVDLGGVVVVGLLRYAVVQPS